MSFDLKTLINPAELKDYCEALSVADLEKVHSELRSLIATRRENFRETELERKGRRVLDDMRGLMAKSGVSMSEFQSALERL